MTSRPRVRGLLNIETSVKFPVPVYVRLLGKENIYAIVETGILVSVI